MGKEANIEIFDNLKNRYNIARACLGEKHCPVLEYNPKTAWVEISTISCRFTRKIRLKEFRALVNDKEYSTVISEK